MGKSLIIKGADFSQNGIAPEFIQLDWVSSRNNNQYFNTNLVRSGKMKLVIEFSLTDALLNNDNIGNRCGLIGCNASTNDNDYFNLFWLPYSNSDKALYGVTKSNNAGWYSADSQIKNTNKHIAELDSSKFVLDGTLIKSTVNPVVTAGTYKIYVMGINDAINNLKYCYAHIHSAKIYSDYEDNSSLILDVIPVKRTEDDKVCLYDKVSQSYIYTNDDVNPNYGELA